MCVKIPVAYALGGRRSTGCCVDRGEIPKRERNERCAYQISKTHICVSFLRSVTRHERPSLSSIRLTEAVYELTISPYIASIRPVFLLLSKNK
jgi:hypothetical protein